MNMTDGGWVNTVFVTTTYYVGAAIVANQAGSTGLVNVDGFGSGWETGDLTVAKNGTGTMNITNSGHVYTSGLADIATTAGSVGEVNILGSGSVWNSGGMIVDDSGKGLMNILDGGVVHSVSDAYVGKEAGSNGWVNIIGYGSTWDVGRAHTVVGYGGRGRMEVFDGGTFVSSATLQIGGDSAASRGWVDVSKGIVIASNIKNGTDGTGKFNILGPDSNIYFFSGYNSEATKLDTWFYVNSQPVGNSTVNVNGGTIDYTTGTFHVTVYGFAARHRTDTFDIFNASAAASCSGTFSAPQIKPVNTPTTGVQTVAFRDDLPIWDLDTQEYYYAPSDRKYDGWVEVTGTPIYGIQVRFDLGTAYHMADTLSEYLRNGMEGSNYVLPLYQVGITSGNFYVDFYLKCDSLKQPDAYNVLGWGLDHFNDYNDTNISLIFLMHGITEGPPAPEPSTYVLLLSDAVLLFCLGRKRVV